MPVPTFIKGNNSGARIGLCKELQNCFQLAWIDKELGKLDYVYLTPSDYSKYSSLVIAEHLLANDESRYKITAIVGNDDCGTAALKGRFTIFTGNFKIEQNNFFIFFKFYLNILGNRT